MRSEEIATLLPGDRIWQWTWTGGNTSGVLPMTVVRVNLVTVTVDTDAGDRVRVPHDVIEGRVDWEEARPSDQRRPE